MNGELKTYPLSPDNWDDFESLMGPKGGCAGCWCMWWKLKRREWEEKQGSSNKALMKSIVASGISPGLLLFRDDEVIAWCAIEPRDQYPPLNRSRTLKAIDDQPVWSITCIFIARNARGEGLTEQIIAAALGYAQQSGAQIVEAYPIDKDTNNYPVIYAGTGFISSFHKVGFKECIRRSKTQPIMRYVLDTNVSDLAPGAN